MNTAVPRCQVIPQAGRQVSFQIDEREVLRWHEGLDYPRPYFFPVVAPSGQSLTRMGHPGAPNHDHHQSIWFAHHKVMGIDFWGNNSPAKVRQLQWLCYQDDDLACRMAVVLGWFDGHDPAPLMKQELICEVCPGIHKGEFTIELQSRLTPMSETLDLQQTNFGLLAVRVAKNISGHFGGGVLTSSEGVTGEKAIFGRPARWMDYSGTTDHAGLVTEGITYHDHPSNTGQPTGWHVREDGWMCASPTMNQSVVLTSHQPLMLRYLLAIHQGPVSQEATEQRHQHFVSLPPLQVAKSGKPHHQWELLRLPTE